MIQKKITNSVTLPQEPVPIDLDPRDNLLHTIISANQQILKNQSFTISKLRQQLSNAQNRFTSVQKQLQMFQDSMPLHQKSQTKRLVDYVAELQRKLSEEKVKSAIKEEAALAQQYISFKNTKSTSSIKYKKETSINPIQEDPQLENWLKAINLYTNTYKNERFIEQTTDLLKKFIPNKLRYKVWPLVFDNKLGITSLLYTQLLQRRNQKQIPQKVVGQIGKDLQRSFCGKTQFEIKTGLLLEVAQVLQIFHIYRPDVSYVQGMTYPVIVLILIVGKIKAFRIFANIILSNSFYRRLFTFESDCITLYCRTFDTLLLQENPKLAEKLQFQKIQSEIFLIEWFFTFFSRGLSFNFTLKVWDLFAYHGQIVHFKVALSIFSIIGPKLMKTIYEDTIGFIRDYNCLINEIELITLIINHKLSTEKLEKAILKNRKYHQ